MKNSPKQYISICSVPLIISRESVYVCFCCLNWQFTAYTYQQTVEPEREATFEYSFIPNEAFSSRAFGLTVNLNYRDSVSVLYVRVLLMEFVILVLVSLTNFEIVQVFRCCCCSEGKCLCVVPT